MSRPPTIARILDRCDVCGKKIHRQELVRTQMRYLKPQSSNQFLYSSYSATGWACDATDGGEIGIGTRADKTRTKVASDGTVSIVNGVQCWQGSGSYRSILGVDVSSAAKFTVSAVVAPYYTSESPELSITMGLCDADGANTTSERTWTTSGLARTWYTVTVGNIASPLAASSVYVYWSVTPADEDQYWQIEDCQLELDATGDKPGEFVKSTGSSITVATDTETMTTRKVCPDCYEVLLVKSEQFGRPYTEVEPPISSDPQEV